jgi:hypothetical protein
METGTARAVAVEVSIGGVEETVDEAELRAERKRQERAEKSRSARIKTKAAAKHRLQWCSICHEDQRHLVVLNFGWTEVAVCGACLVEARRRVTQQLGLRVQLP